jgi:hypothetical protein
MTVSFESDIKRLFRNRDQNCMAGPNHRIDLRSYSFMSNPDGDENFADHATARRVYRALQPDADPRMPFDGAYWNDEQMALFKQWMDDGFLP